MACVLAALILSEVLIYYQPVSPYLDERVSLSVVDGTLIANITAKASYPAHLRETFYYTNRPTMPLDIYLYFDAAYPYSFSDVTDWYGISQHLDALGNQRGIAVDVRVIDAAGLASFLTQPPSQSTVLIMASGVFPDTVFTTSTNLVTPWIEAGGTLVWSGDKIGTYSGVPGVPLKYPSPSNPGTNGTRQFVNLSLFGTSNTSYPTPSLAATLLGLNYSAAVHFDDLNVSGVQTFGGVTLGNLNGGYTNIASLPLGNGTLVYFGGPTISAQTMAYYIFNILQSGAEGFAFSPFDSVTVTLAPSAESTASIHSLLPALPEGYTSNDVFVCAFGFQTDYGGVFAQTTCLPL